MPGTPEDCVTTLIIMAMIGLFKAWDLHTAGVALGVF